MLLAGQTILGCGSHWSSEIALVVVLKAKDRCQGDNINVFFSWKFRSPGNGVISSYQWQPRSGKESQPERHST